MSGTESSGKAGSMSSHRVARPCIFLECTTTYLAGGNTGIQRVVRNTTRYCQAAARDFGVACQPVVWDESLRRFRKIDHAKLTSDALAAPAEQRADLLKRGKEAILRLPWPIRQVLLQRHIKEAIKRAARWVSVALWLPWKRRRMECVNFRDGDVLFLLDSTWHIPPWAGVRQAKRRGARIGAMLYDLVPVVDPASCVEDLVRSFRLWLDQVQHYADFFVCISASVAEQARDFLASRHPRIRRGEVAFGYSHLGVGLDLAAGSQRVRGELRAIFDAPQAETPYVCISTFEPRKNQKHLVDAFDQAWSQGLRAALVLAGKHGWKCDDLLERIDRHPRRGRGLWVFHDLNDDEVAYCYRHARATLSASRIEGFGLPAVEALSSGCEVWLSDIPVYREVGGDFCLYFDLNSTDSLREMLLANERSGGIHPPRPVRDFTWPDWQASTGHLLRRILELSGIPLSLPAESTHVPSPRGRIS